MRVLDTLTRGERNCFSVEVEPPSIGQSLADLFALTDPLVDRGIRYIDITYHAEHVVGYVTHYGQRFPVSQRKKPGTAGVAGALRERYKHRGVEPVPHVICTGFTQYASEEYLVELAFLGIENVMALRGDGPKGPDGQSLPFIPTVGGHAYADGLIKQIVNLGKGIYAGAHEGHPLAFCIGAACYPEGYASTAAWDKELEWLKVKVDAGADYLVTQMFFANEVYWRFVDRVRQLGIDVPIVPGIKPLTTLRHLEVLPRVFGCALPESLVKRIDKYRESPGDIRNVGIDWSIEQCEALRDSGAPSLHFYAARRSPVAEIIEQLL